MAYFSIIWDRSQTRKEFCIVEMRCGDSVTYKSLGSTYADDASQDMIPMALLFPNSKSYNNNKVSKVLWIKFVSSLF